MSYIALLCPAAVSLALFRKRRGSEFKAVDNILAYLAFALIINWADMLVMVHYLKIYDASQEALGNFGFFVKYTAVALVFALVLPSVFDMFYKFVVIKFDDKRRTSGKGKDGK